MAFMLPSQAKQLVNTYGQPTQQAQPGQNPYTREEISKFIDDKGIRNNPHAVYAYATSPEHQGRINLADIDAVMGGPTGASSTWMMEQGLNNPWRERPQAGAQPQNPYMPNPTMNPNQPMAGGGGGGNPVSQVGGGGGVQSRGDQWTGTSYQPNPYTQQMMGNITQAVNQNLQRNVLPSLRRGQVANGTLGSTRQGIAEGIAIGDTNQALANAGTNLYAGQFNQDRDFGLRNDAMDLSAYNANMGWMNQGQRNQMDWLNNLMGWQQQGIQNANNVQNTPLNYFQQFANLGSQLGGMGSQQTQQLQGNPYLGALGGWMMGSRMFNQNGG